MQAVAAGLLTVVAAATAVSGQMLTAGLVGSQLQEGIELSCVTEQTCGSLDHRERCWAGSSSGCKLASAWAHPFPASVVRMKAF